MGFEATLGTRQLAMLVVAYEYRQRIQVMTSCQAGLGRLEIDQARGPLPVFRVLEMRIFCLHRLLSSLAASSLAARFSAVDRRVKQALK
jgi:hypothetical protein